jgi:hypothetical protein
VAVVGLVALGGATGCAEPRGTVAATTTSTAITLPPETTTTTELPLSAGRQLTRYTPEVGDCFDRRKAEGIDPKTAKPREPDEEVILRLDCNQPHSFEVFAVVDITTPDFPGEPTLVNQGKAACARYFGDYVGAPYETSSIEIAYFVPSGRTWPDLARKVIGCTLRDPSGKATGSLKGSAR